MQATAHTTYQSVTLRYINHKVKLASTTNYKTNMRFQRAVGRLSNLKRWLEGAGKFADQITVFKMIKMYRNDMYDALPHPQNKAFNSCSETLKEIFE